MHSFLPNLFSCERKEWAVGDTSETALPERDAACGVSFPIRPFLPFHPAGQACGVVFSFFSVCLPVRQDDCQKTGHSVCVVENGMRVAVGAELCVAHVEFPRGTVLGDGGGAL